jgi:outer membrane protein TolC
MIGFCKLGFAQTDQLLLDSCYKMAKRNYPLVKQKNLIDELEKNALDNANKSWLPRLNFTSKATYQSEVIAFLGRSFPKDNYMTAIDLEQNIFDGGQIKSQKAIEHLNGENQRISQEVELYKLNDRITQLYCSILLCRENIKVIDLFKEDIKARKKNLESAVKNGLTLESTLFELEAEELKAEQNQSELKENLKGLYNTLGMYIGVAVSDATILVSSDLSNLNSSSKINRPEIKLFETQKSMLEARHKMITQLALPKLSFNAQGAYGRPGPNFLNQNLRFFAQGGINLRWNMATLYTMSNENKSFAINQKLIDVQKETFEFNIKTQLEQHSSQVASLKDILLKDDLIIEKRKSICNTSSKQLENGSITASDYILQLDAQMQALLNKKIHEIKLINAIANFRITAGTIN